MFQFNLIFKQIKIKFNMWPIPFQTRQRGTAYGVGLIWYLDTSLYGEIERTRISQSNKKTFILQSFED